jgi:hypothetical protein
MVAPTRVLEVDRNVLRETGKLCMEVVLRGRIEVEQLSLESRHAIVSRVAHGIKEIINIFGNMLVPTASLHL